MLHHVSVTPATTDRGDVGALDSVDACGRGFSNQPFVFGCAHTSVHVEAFRTHPAANQHDHRVLNARSVQGGGKARSEGVEGVDRGDARTVEVGEHISEETVKVVVSVGLATARGKERGDVAARAGEAVAQLNVADRGGGVDRVAIIESEDHGEGAVYLTPWIWLRAWRRNDGGVSAGLEGVELRHRRAFDDDTVDAPRHTVEGDVCDLARAIADDLTEPEA